MGTPQIAMIVLLAVSGTLALVKHGEPKGEYNFYLWIPAAAIELSLLIWGGFFG